MPLIDEKGRLWGRVNLINALVVLVLIVAAVAGAYKLLLVEKQGLVETQVLLVTFEVAGVRQPSVDAVNIGERVSGYEAQIYLGDVAAKQVEPHRVPVATADGRILMAEVPGVFDLYIVVRAQAVVGPNAITVGGREAKIGLQLPLTGRLFSFKALIVGIEEASGQ